MTGNLQNCELGASTIERVLYDVQKPSRYVGLELNASMRPWHRSHLRICLAFPEVYEIGMSHLGLQVLYRILNDIEGVAADRAYCPWPDMEAALNSKGVPLWGIESRRPLYAFDIIGFSLQNELLYTNMLTMLELAGVPHLSRDRSADDPIIISGGPCASNPEPYAPFVDAVCIGDGEELVREAAILLERLKKTGTSRSEMLAALGSIEGVYIPAYYEARADDIGRLSLLEPIETGAPPRVRRRIVRALAGDWIPDTPLVPSASVVQERLNIEVARGCTWGCRFCHAGYFQRPLRERDPNDVLAAAERGIASSGFDEVNLLSLSTADYSALLPLLGSLLDCFGSQKVALALPSLRINSMSPDIALKIRQVKKTGFTFAPEAGTQRLRDVINKVFTDDDIMKAVESAFQTGWNLVKLYFMIGLPTETDDDIHGIVTLVNRITRLPAFSGPGKTLNVSIGAFVPKPHTAFQWEPFEDVRSLEAKLQKLKSSFPGKKVNVKWQNIPASFLEAALSRGDRRFARVIERAWRSGARFDSWTDQLDTALWEKAFEAEDVDPALYCGAWEVDSPLPWDIVDTGISKQFLKLERERAGRGETTPNCRTSSCQGCGLPGAPSDNRLVDADSLSRAGERTGPAYPEPRLRQAVRIRYSVTGFSRFLSHLDRSSILKRAILRDGLEPVHTQGYSPRPKISLGPPLPLGIASIVEFADFLMGGTYLEEELLEKLVQGFPEGMAVEALSLVFPESLPPASDIAAIWYDFDFSTAREDLWERIAENLEMFTGAREFPYAREKKGKTIVVDLKRAVPVFEAVQGPKRKFTMCGCYNTPDGQNAGPGDVIAGILKLSTEETAGVRIVRTGYSGTGGREFPLP